MHSHLRRTFFAATAVLTCWLGSPAVAVGDFWTSSSGGGSIWNSSGVSYWPVNGDTPIFYFIPALPKDIVFLHDWRFTQDSGYGSPGLILSDGGLSVAAGHTVVIDANVLIAKGSVLVSIGPIFPDGTFLTGITITVTGDYLGDFSETFTGLPFSPFGVRHADSLAAGFVSFTPGLLTKSGEGTLLFERSVIGNILIAEGTLGGNFTLYGDLRNEAALAPGNSPGKIQVNGNFTQTRSGQLQIQVASPTNYDQLQISQQAKLAGAIEISLLDHYLPRKGQKFYILSADGGVSGHFDEVNAPVWNDLTLRPFYQDDRVYLKTVINSFEALPGLTPNQQAVAHVLDETIGDGRAGKLLNYLYDRNFDHLPRDLDRLAPEELTSVFTLGVSLATVQSLNIQRRTDDLRSGSSGFSAANLAINGHGPGYSGAFGLAGPVGPVSPSCPVNPVATGDVGKELKETKEFVPAENRWGAFLSGTGEWVSVGNTDNARGYDLASGGFTLGVDYKVSPHFAIGLAAGYTGTTADLVDRGRVWVNGGKLGLYTTTFAGGWYADTAVFGGYNSYDTRRGALQGQARGDTDGGELNVLFGTGYDFKKGKLTFGPTASFNYTYLGLNGFTEHGSLAPLDIHGGKDESLRTAFGFKVSCECKCGNLMIKPELRAAWQHEFGDSASNLSSSFANGAGDSFIVAGPRIGRDSALLGAGFAAQLNERCSTYVYYDGELGRTNYRAANLTGGIRVTF